MKDWMMVGRSEYGAPRVRLAPPRGAVIAFARQVLRVDFSTQV
jgi:hypothetical protein